MARPRYIGPAPALVPHPDGGMVELAPGDELPFDVEPSTLGDMWSTSATVLPKGKPAPGKPNPEEEVKP